MKNYIIPYFQIKTVTRTKLFIIIASLNHHRSLLTFTLAHHQFQDDRGVRDIVIGGRTNALFGNSLIFGIR